MQVFNQLHAFIWESTTTNNCNSYLIDGPTRVLIDPGHLNLFGHVKNGLEELDLAIEDIGLVICTHAHPDHIEAIQIFKETRALITIHETEWQLLKDMQSQIAAAYGTNLDSITPDFFLKEGDISINGLELNVLHTPGHSPGSVSLYWPGQKALFAGDLVFKEGVGRTDLPGGNGEQLKNSITRLAQLKTDWILPGHGGIISGTGAVKSNFNEIEHYWFRYI